MSVRRGVKGWCVNGEEEGSVHDGSVGADHEQRGCEEEELGFELHFEGFVVEFGVIEGELQALVLSAKCLT